MAHRASLTTLGTKASSSASSRLSASHRHNVEFLRILLVSPFRAFYFSPLCLWHACIHFHLNFHFIFLKFSQVLNFFNCNLFCHLAGGSSHPFGSMELPSVNVQGPLSSSSFTSPSRSMLHQSLSLSLRQCGPRLFRNRLVHFLRHSGRRRHCLNRVWCKRRRTSLFGSGSPATKPHALPGTTHPGQCGSSTLPSQVHNPPRKGTPCSPDQFCPMTFDARLSTLCSRKSDEERPSLSDHDSPSLSQIGLLTQPRLHIRRLATV